MSSKRSWTVATSLLIGALLVVSCAPTPTSREGAGTSASGGAGSSAATGSAVPKTLRLGMQASNEPTGGTDGPRSPAPYGGSGNGSPALEHYLMFHAGLTMFDPQNQVVPRLAQKLPSLEDGDWKLLPGGGMEVTWKIRPGVRWHDGTPLTADDFVLGFMMIRDPQIPITTRGETPSIAEVRAADPQTVVAIWKTQSVLGNVSNNDGIPAVPRHLFGELYAAGDLVALENSSFWNTQWVGLGPYRMGEWALGSHMEGIAFDGYFLGRPKIDRVIIKYIGDVNALIANALSGDIDVAPLGAQLDIPQMVTVRDAWAPTGGGLTMVSPKGVRTIYLQLRDPAAPWAQDVRIRQALAHGLDREEFVATLLYGLTEVAHYFLAPAEPAYKLAEQRGLPRYPFDLARTERLMVDAGWTRGSDRLFRNSAGQPLAIDVTASNQGANVQEAQTIAAQWSAAGYQSAPTPYPAAAQNAAEIRHRNPGALIWPYNFSQTVIKTFTQSEIGTEAVRWRGGNYSGYVNLAYDTLYDELANTFDASKRHEITFQMLKILAEQLPAIPIFFTPLCLIARKGVEGPGAVSPMQAANAWNIHTWELKS